MLTTRRSTCRDRRTTRLRESAAGGGGRGNENRFARRVPGGFSTRIRERNRRFSKFFRQIFAHRKTVLDRNRPGLDRKETNIERAVRRYYLLLVCYRDPCSKSGRRPVPEKTREFRYGVSPGKNLRLIRPPPPLPPTAETFRARPGKANRNDTCRRCSSVKNTSLRHVCETSLSFLLQLLLLFFTRKNVSGGIGRTYVRGQTPPHI